ncbi:MAG: rRNA maturation RNase YbeY [Planctomycetota bacterium]
MPQPPTSDSVSLAETGSPDADAAEPPSSPAIQASKPATEVDLTFTLDTDDTDPPAAGWLEERLAEALRLSGVVAGSLSVTLIDDPTMIQLHAEHCDDPSPTDVLTFDLADRPAASPGDPVTHIDGDLVICRDEAKRQVASRGHDARTELLLYAVHGLMHLLGEKDHDEADYQRMHQREDQLLTRMGLGPVFHGSDASPPADGDSDGSAA